MVFQTRFCQIPQTWWNPIKSQQKITTLKKPVYTELRHCNGLEIKILKRHNYAINFTEKNPTNLQGVKKNQILKKKKTQPNKYICVCIYFTMGIHSEFHRKKCQGVELGQYLMTSYVLWKRYQEKVITKNYSKK